MQHVEVYHLYDGDCFQLVQLLWLRLSNVYPLTGNRYVWLYAVRVWLHVSPEVVVGVGGIAKQIGVVETKLSIHYSLIGFLFWRSWLSKIVTRIVSGMGSPPSSHSITF